MSAYLSYIFSLKIRPAREFQLHVAFGKSVSWNTPMDLKQVAADSKQKLRFMLTKNSLSPYMSSTVKLQEYQWHVYQYLYFVFNTKYFNAVKWSIKTIKTYSNLIIPESQKCSCVPENTVKYHESQIQRKIQIIHTKMVLNSASQPTPLVSWEWDVPVEGLNAHHHDKVTRVDSEVRSEGSL